MQTLEVYDALVAELEAVLNTAAPWSRPERCCCTTSAISWPNSPTGIREQVPTGGKLESRLRTLETINADTVSTRAGAYRLSWLGPLVDHDRHTRRQIRALERRIDELLDAHGTTLRDEPGVGTITAATLICEVGDPFRFAHEAKFARWCGTGAVAMSSGEGDTQPVRHRLDIGGNRRVNSAIYIISITQQRVNPDAQTYLTRKAAEGKTRKEARRAHKRQLANRIIRRMWKDESQRQNQQTNHGRLTRERLTPPRGLARTGRCP